MADELNSVRSGRMVIAAAIVVIAAIALVTAALLLSGGGKPVPAPRSVSFEGKEEDSPMPSSGETVTLQPDQIKAGGIRFEEVGEGAVSGSGAVIGTGIIQPDAYKDVRLVALVGGIVKSVNFEPGTKVQKGAVIGVAESDGFVKAQGDFLTARVAAENARKAHDRSLRLLQINQPGRSEYDGALRAFVSAEAAAAEVRSRYERAGKLVEIGSISREQFDIERSKLASVEAELVEAKNRLERAKSLLDVSPEAKAQAETAQVELSRTQAELSSLRERLSLLGMAEAEIEALSSQQKIDRSMKLRAPISGTLLSRAVAPGQIFDVGSELLRIADLTDVWFMAQVAEETLNKIPVGSVVDVAVAGSVRIQKGRVVYRDPSVNEKSRTVQVRIVIRNAGKDMLLGSYATVSSSGLDDAKVYPLVKASAIQNLEGRNYVFAVMSDGVTFEMRQVRTGDEMQGLVPVLEGLTRGEKVVVEGAFLLRAEYLKRKGN